VFIQKRAVIAVSVKLFGADSWVLIYFFVLNTGSVFIQKRAVIDVPVKLFGAVSRVSFHFFVLNRGSALIQKRAPNCCIWSRFAGFMGPDGRTAEGEEYQPTQQ
jgi:hypothetical protein